MANTGNLKPWKKGQSGNPGGRSKAKDDVKTLAQQYTTEAITALAASLKDPDQRVKAAAVLLDRGYGKPQQTLEVKRSPVDELDTATLAALQQLAAERVAEAAGSDSGATLASPAGNVLPV